MQKTDVEGMTESVVSDNILTLLVLLLRKLAQPEIGYKRTEHGFR